MTAPTGLRDVLRGVVTNEAVPHQEWPSVVRRRRVVVIVVLVLGAALLGISLTRQPGEASFYWLTFALAGTWAAGAFLSGPLHMGSISWRGRNQRPVLTGIGIGALLGGAFVVGGLIAREIEPVAALITRVLIYANQGTLLLVVVITLVNGVAEEMFFRGALYSALGRHRPVLVSTFLYILVTCASGNPMLGFAAVILGTVCELERRACSS